MRKLLTILLALALVLGMTGALAQEPVQLLIWEAEGPELDFIKEAAAKFTELNPHITFEFAGVSHTDAVQKLELDGPTGLGADVFAAPHDKLGQIVVGQLALPLNDGAAGTLKEAFMPAAQAAVTYDGVPYGYPTAIETYALFYNKDLIPEAPKTWEEIVEFAKTFNDVANNKFAMVWEVSAPYYNYIFMSAYGADLFGPEGTDQERHDINSEAAVKGLSYFQSLREAMLPVKAEDLSGSFCNGAFTETKTAAMFITGPWSIDGVVKAGVNRREVHVNDLFSLVTVGCYDSLFHIPDGVIDSKNSGELKEGRLKYRVRTSAETKVRGKAYCVHRVELNVV